MGGTSFAIVGVALEEWLADIGRNALFMPVYVPYSADELSC
jgi:hypothetical protein